ncbi:MAG: isoprenyl transferase [Bdellovibrionota bacterium]
MSPGSLSATINNLKSNPAMPKHVAIIMDGNGRWAQEHARPRVWGHKKGVESVRAVVETAGQLELSALTLFAFSEENWGRPSYEVEAIIKLLDTYVVKERDALHRNNVVFRTIGDLSRLPKSTRRRIEETKDYLKGNTGLVLNVAISYGGRSEIADACRQIASKVQEGSLTLEKIDQNLVDSFMYTKGLPDIDLVIRTSGELRVSNFLLWQIAYAELYFSQIYWPDFRQLQFIEAIRDFLGRKRRFGLLEDKVNSKESTKPIPSENSEAEQIPLKGNDITPSAGGLRC